VSAEAGAMLACAPAGINTPLQLKHDAIVVAMEKMRKKM